MRLLNSRCSYVDCRNMPVMETRVVLLLRSCHQPPNELPDQPVRAFKFTDSEQPTPPQSIRAEACCQQSAFLQLQSTTL